MLDNFNKIDNNKKLSLFRDGSSASMGFTDVESTTVQSMKLSAPQFTGTLTLNKQTIANLNISANYTFNAAAQMRMGTGADTPAKSLCIADCKPGPRPSNWCFPPPCNTDIYKSCPLARVQINIM